MPKGQHKNHSHSSAHGRWNDGRIISSHGYTKVRVGRGHPLADPNGYAYEHLLVWVAAGKKHPGENEILHHRNHDKADSRIENLEVLDRQEHVMVHGALKLTDEQVREILDLHHAGKSQISLAKRFHVSKGYVSKIVNGDARQNARRA